MFADIVFPKGNEEEFIRLAKRLSIGAICFAYEYHRKDDHKERAERIRRLQESSGIELSYGLMAKRGETREARKFADLILVRSTPENREALEQKEVDSLFGLEDNPRQDSMHYRYSSLNQVLAHIAQENNTLISFPFRMCLLAESERRAVLMGRISQNIRICRKYKAPAALASFAAEPFEMRNPSDLLSFGIVLGMTPGQAKAAINAVRQKIEENKGIKSGRILGAGIMFVD